jgi:hypothetical protein
MLCLASLLCAASTLSPAEAYVLTDSDFFCVGPIRWSFNTGGYTSHPTYRMCHNMASSNPPGFTDLANVSTAVGWGHWMWQKDAMSRFELYHNTSYCRNDGRANSNGDWFDDGEESSDWSFDTWQNICPWYESDAYCQSYNGLHSPDNSTCLGGSQNRIASDIAIISNCPTPWTADNINSILRCVTVGNYIDAVHVHELGHAYGLMHNDAFMTGMNTMGPPVRCSAGSGFHPGPWADELQGQSFLYGYPQAGNFNIGGSATVGTPGSPQIPAQSFVGVCSTTQLTATFTYLNDYAEPSSFLWRYLLLPGSSTNPASYVWIGPTLSTGSKFPGATYPVAWPLSIPHTVMTTGVTYRVWVQMDPWTQVSERDEHDNMIPLNITLSRGAGC